MASPEVEYAEPDRVLHPQFTPNDTQYGQQWHYFEAMAGINLPAAWDKSTGSGVVVAVLDTGYRPHADLAANVLPGYDMIIDTFVANDGTARDNGARDPGDTGDDVSTGACGGGLPLEDEASRWHGTHAVGTIAAVSNNASGVAGVAFNAKVLPVRVLGRCGALHVGHRGRHRVHLRWHGVPACPPIATLGRYRTPWGRCSGPVSRRR